MDGSDRLGIISLVGSPNEWIAHNYCAKLEESPRYRDWLSIADLKTELKSGIRPAAAAAINRLPGHYTQHCPTPFRTNTLSSGAVEERNLRSPLFNTSASTSSSDRKTKYQRLVVPLLWCLVLCQSTHLLMGHSTREAEGSFAGQLFFFSFSPSMTKKSRFSSPRVAILAFDI